MIATQSRSRAPPDQPRPRPAGERDSFSFSALRTYQGCPLRYFFRYVAGLPEKTVSASLIFGAGIHRAIEHHFRELLEGNEPPSQDALFLAYEQEWQERQQQGAPIAKEESKDSLDSLARRMLAAFQQSTLATPAGKVLAVEEELRGNLVPGVPDLVGKLDLIIEKPDELVISDWKTSRTRWSEEQIIDGSEQLLLYAELAKDFAPGKPIRLEFAVLTKTKEVAVQVESLKVSQRRVDRTKRVVERVWKAISSEHFYPSPSPMACGSCPYREPCRSWSG